MPDDDVKQLADAWKDAYNELWDASRPPVSSSEWESKQRAYKKARNAYYRLLRDQHDWEPPAGVNLDDD
jgi:hypothetical protein